MTLPNDHAQRIARARRSLDALATGDALGDQFFRRWHADRLGINASGRYGVRGMLPPGPWDYTDDTVMAISVVDVLARYGTIRRGPLARLFATRYEADDRRQYGGTAHGVLQQLGQGVTWREAAGGVFGGDGSKGNGGAMRAAPVGAYFADEFSRAGAEARRSAEVTHAHPEGQAGAEAVAIATAYTATGGHVASELFAAVLDTAARSSVRDGCAKASRLPLTYDVQTAVAALGNGSGVIAEDTVPFSLWCAARHLGDLEGAFWTTVSGLGDRDTTCAIVCGIVGAAPDAEVPPNWTASREPLDTFALNRIDYTRAGWIWTETDAQRTGGADT